MDRLQMAWMKWLEVRDAAKRGTLILPVGSLEQHGPHLPLSTDLLIAQWVADELSRRLEIPVAPPLPYGVSLEHLGFPGTVSLDPHLMLQIILDLGRSFWESGFRRLFLINGHAGNTGILDAAAREVKARVGLEVYVFNLQEIMASIAGSLGHESEVREHAGFVETSVMMHLGHVSEEEIRGLGQKSTGEPKAYPPGLVSYGWSSREFSETGQIGEAAKADREVGRRILERTLEYIYGVAESVLRGGL